MQFLSPFRIFPGTVDKKSPGSVSEELIFFSGEHGGSGSVHLYGVLQTIHLQEEFSQTHGHSRVSVSCCCCRIYPSTILWVKVGSESKFVSSIIDFVLGTVVSR